MTLGVVVLVHNQFDVARECLRLLDLHTSPETPICVVDNGSSSVLSRASWIPARALVVRVAENFGNYPVFSRIRPQNWDAIAYFHSDLMVDEPGWDQRVIEAMQAHDLSLCGFVGSSEIDENGGRGGGTVSNFQGALPNGSPAEAHGKRVDHIMPAAVVDGCAMIFKRSMLEAIPHRPGFPPHHFYDRLLSCEVLERGGRVAVVGIACDHWGGRTAVLEPGWHALCESWCQTRGIVKPVEGGWELGLYREAERQFLSEYRDQKGLAPCYVTSDWALHRGKP